MIVFFLSEDEKSVIPLVERMRSYGHVALSYNDIEDLCVAVSENAVEGISLLVSDYRIFGTKSRCPYDTMAGIMRELKCPFIFFNDPFPELPELYDHWMRILHEYSLGLYREAPMIQTVHNLRECVAAERHSCERKSHAEKMTSNELIKKMDSLCRIPPSKKSLLSLLVENRGDCIDGEDICLKLWGSSEKLMTDRLHSYISWLRKNVLSVMREPYAQILSDGNGSYLFRTCEFPRKILPED